LCDLTGGSENPRSVAGFCVSFASLVEARWIIPLRKTEETEEDNHFNSFKTRMIAFLKSTGGKLTLREISHTEIHNAPEPR
jgi:hypothetical protein